MPRLTLFLSPSLQHQLELESKADGLAIHYEAMKIIESWMKEHATERKVRDGMKALGDYFA